MTRNMMCTVHCRFLLTVLQPQFCSDMVRILRVLLVKLVYFENVGYRKMQ